MVTCATVRDLLPEHALGVGGSLENAAVDRHLSWCAACRKEARDLDRAAATFAFALPLAEPEPELEAVVRQRVRALAHPTSRQTAHRGRRRAGVILLAAAIASATFAGAALSDRQGTQEQIPATVDRNTEALDALRRVILQSEHSDPEAEAYLGTLMPAAEGGTAGGSALTIVAPSVDDQVMIIVAGLPRAERRLPYRVSLRDVAGHRLLVGTITVLDAGGGATVARIVTGSLSGFVHVLVRDARGHVVLDGTLTEPTSIVTPSP